MNGVATNDVPYLRLALIERARYVMKVTFAVIVAKKENPIPRVDANATSQHVNFFALLSSASAYIAATTANHCRQYFVDAFL